MAKHPSAFSAYQQASDEARKRKKATPTEGEHYYRYRGKNLMGLVFDDIFSATSEDDLRDKLAKQMIMVEEVREITFQQYQCLFEEKRNTVVERGHSLARAKEQQRQQQLDNGTINPEEELDNFISRFKQFVKDTDST